jgi:hypothetical protein
MEMHLSDGSGTYHGSFAIHFLSICVELTVGQVAVKSLLVYACDEVGEAMEKKTTVSNSMKVCINRYSLTYLTACRGYGAN